jgi:two-component system, cell cycle response regulator
LRRSTGITTFRITATWRHTQTFRNEVRNTQAAPIDSNRSMSSPAETRVLVADDSPIYRRLITANLLEWGFDAVVVNSGSEAWEKLKTTIRPHLGGAGLDHARHERSGALPKDPPTGKFRKLRLHNPADREGQPWRSAQGNGSRGDDLLTKPFDELELRVRLLVGKRIIGLHQELIAAREAMRAAATFDALTGLLNRREIIDDLRRELARASREKRPVSIILADLDYFKRINEQYGHLVGDEVLKEVARRLQCAVRTYDRVGRYGGEEFLIVVPGCDLVSAFTRADKIRTLISDKPIATDSGSISIGLSIGLAFGHGNQELETLLHQADLGLYQAKRNGRNRVELADEGATIAQKRH